MNKQNKQEQKQLLVFGYGLPLICLFLAWRQYAKHGLTGWVQAFLIAAVVVVLMALFARPWLKVVFKYWMKAAHAIGTVLTTVILTVFFFGVITPTSLILRLLGKDFMNLRLKGQIDSYWIKRGNQHTDYRHQF
jgi:hypothetical protein